MMSYNNYNNTNQANRVQVYKQDNNMNFNNRLSNSQQNLNTGLNLGYNYQNSNYPVSNTYYQNNLNNSFVNNSFNNNNQYQNNNMNRSNSYQNLNYRTATTYTPNNFNNGFQNNSMFTNRTYPNNYTMTNNFNNYQNNGYGMFMGNSYLNNNYQNLYNTMFNSYPRMNSTYQNNNFQNNNMGYTQNFANSQQMFNNITPQNTKSDEQIVEEILNCRRNLEKLTNNNESMATTIYYRESIKILKEMLNNGNRNIILDNESLENLLDVVKTGYSKFMKLDCNSRKIEAHKEKIIQIYVFLKFLQASQKIGRNAYFINALKNIEATEELDRYGFTSTNLGSKFEFYINNLNNEQIRLLNLAVGRNIKDQHINYLGYPQNESPEYQQYGYNNRKKSKNKIDEEIIEDIMKYRKTMEEEANENIDLMIENYHKKCSEIINELSNNEDQYIKNNIIPNIKDLLYEEKEKYEKLNRSHEKRKYKKEIVQIYVLLKLLQESQDIGKNENLKKDLATLKSKEKNLGLNHEIYIHQLDSEEHILMNMALGEKITDENIENIKLMKNAANQKKHMKEDIEEIKKDGKIIDEIVKQKKQIEKTNRGNKQLQTRTYCLKCMELINEIYKDPKNLVLNKGKIGQYQNLLMNTYNVYEVYNNNAMYHYGNGKETIKKIENNFMKMFVLLSLAYKSENLGKNRILIDEIRKMDYATIETSEAEEIINKFEYAEQAFLSYAFCDFYF